jgi:transcriptional regulator GlxA family with amidase domain
VVRGVLADRATATNPLIAGPARRLLASAAVAAFPRAGHVAPRRGTGQVAPAALRRAMAYAQENADRDITVADMAAAAGLGTRALQYAFRRHHDTTPLAYARRARLDRAHRDLRAADPTTGATVAAIAARWGFAHPGRFSTDYRAAYGRSPTRTLRD